MIFVSGERLVWSKYTSTTKEEKFQKPTEIERRRTIDYPKEEFSYRAVAGRVHRNSSTVMRVWKQGIYEHRKTREVDCGRRKVTSARDNKLLLLMELNDCIAYSWMLVALWSTATGVLNSVASIRLHLLHSVRRARLLLYMISRHCKLSTPSPAIVSWAQSLVS